MDFSKLHILVVEDTEPMRELLVDVLDSLGVQKISVAKNGEDAFRLICLRNPDLILTDWYMSPMDGIALTQKIRTNPASPNRTVPIIMMTGYSSPDRIAQARDQGVTEFLVKPFSVQDLSKRIIHVIKSPRDFIITENFAGPCRRRRKNEEFDGPAKRNGPEGIIKRISASFDLMSRVGVGALDPIIIDRTQKIIDNNEIDFAPLARKYLDDLRQELDLIKTTDHFSLRHLQEISAPVMQIKANARIFKYDRLGDLAAVMLNFIENLKEVDENVIKIINAHDRSLRLLIEKEMTGDGGAIGENFQKELEDVCARYTRMRSENQKRAFEKILGQS